MTFDELFDDLPANGWLQREEARLLLSIASTCQGPILEVGSFCGRSTCLLASLGRPVYAVDPFRDFLTDTDPTGAGVHQQLLDNLYARGLSDRVAIFQTKVEDWIPLPAGFAYLDGDHTYQGTLNQIKAAMDCGVKRLCVHDWCEEGEGRWIKKAVEDSPRLELQVVVGEMAYCEVI